MMATVNEFNLCPVYGSNKHVSCLPLGGGVDLSN